MENTNSPSKKKDLHREMVLGLQLSYFCVLLFSRLLFSRLLFYAFALKLATIRLLIPLAFSPTGSAIFLAAYCCWPRLNQCKGTRSLPKYPELISLTGVPRNSCTAERRFLKASNDQSLNDARVWSNKTDSCYLARHHSQRARRISGLLLTWLGFCLSLALRLARGLSALGKTCICRCQCKLSRCEKQTQKFALEEQFGSQGACSQPQLPRAKTVCVRSILRQRVSISIKIVSPGARDGGFFSFRRSHAKG